MSQIEQLFLQAHEVKARPDLFRTSYRYNFGPPDSKKPTIIVNLDVPSEAYYPEEAGIGYFAQDYPDQKICLEGRFRPGTLVPERLESLARGLAATVVRFEAMLEDG